MNKSTRYYWADLPLYDAPADTPGAVAGSSNPSDFSTKVVLAADYDALVSKLLAIRKVMENEE